MLTLAAAAETAVAGAVLGIGEDLPDAVVETDFVFTKTCPFKQCPQDMRY